MVSRSKQRLKMCVLDQLQLRTKKGGMSAMSGTIGWSSLKNGFKHLTIPLWTSSQNLLLPWISEKLVLELFVHICENYWHFVHDNLNVSFSLAWINLLTCVLAFLSVGVGCVSVCVSGMIIQKLRPISICLHGCNCVLEMFGCREHANTIHDILEDVTDRDLSLTPLLSVYTLHRLIVYQEHKAHTQAKACPLGIRTIDNHLSAQNITFPCSCVFVFRCFMWLVYCVALCTTFW